MSSNFALYGFVLFVGLTSAHASKMINEEACLQAGGQCTAKDECPREIPDEYLNLCPSQQSRGIECCHGISVKETICHNFGGECMPKSGNCPEQLRKPEAEDCEPDTICCVLV